MSESRNIASYYFDPFTNNNSLLYKLFVFQECSLGFARNSRLESWPLDIFVLNVKHDF